MSAESLRYVGDAVPYTYIGDSHSGIGTFLLEDPQSGERIVTRMSGIWRFVAQDVLGPDLMIGEELMQSLRRLGAFHSSPSLPEVPGLRPIQTTYYDEKRTEYLALTEFANSVPYVLTVGEINLRQILGRFAEDDVDFEIPFAADGLERLSRVKPRQTIGWADVLAMLGREFQPLFLGLRLLRSAGLHTIYLHSIPPPTTDDGEAERVYQHSSTGSLRYKLAMLINYLYSAVCNDVGIGFVDLWPMVTERNLLKDEFHLDGLHLNRQASILSVTEVHRQFAKARLQTV